MERNRIDANVRCPSCKGPLYPRVLVCEACGLKVEGEFAFNEFGSLTPDELHFLRVFIYCEGRIRDMEAALGVSYPTVKAHLASIKEKLNLSQPPFAQASQAEARRPATGAEEPAGSEAAAPRQGEELSAEQILNGLESGGITYKDALKLLKAKKKGEKHGEQNVR
jgi:hypothetical protein